MEKYSVKGMSCAACQTRVEKAVSNVDGVESVAVSLLTNSMQVEGSADCKDIIAAVEHAGYEAEIQGNKKENKNSSDDTFKDTETPKLRRRLIVSLVLLVPLMYMSMGHMMWGWPLPEIISNNHVAMGIIQMLLTICILIVNQKFFISGVTSVIHGAPNMDTLVALGSGASLGYSIYVLLAMTNAQMVGNESLVMEYMHDFYFESAAMIVTLITVGKMLESYSKGKTTDALKHLIGLAPKTAVIIQKDEKGNEIEKEISIDEISKGDIFVVKPGDSIPVDGIIIEGNSAIDESALTGESVPVDKKEGMEVASATINQSGYLKCKATRVGEDTTLSQIIKLVTDAATSKAPIAKVADKVSGVFVPVVIVIAVVTIIVWLIAGAGVGFAIARGISVLVISCPCALGLATPVAIMVGNGVGAKNGILFKNASSLENAGKIDYIALDKTGTITQGKPQVTDIVTAKGLDKNELLKIAYSLESKSEHPLAKAIVEYGEKNNVEKVLVNDFEAKVGNGLTGTLIGGEQVIAGNTKLVEKIAVIPEDLKNEAQKLSEQGKTPLYFAKEKTVIGMIAVADVIKKDSRNAIKALENMGIKVIMLTGDNEKTAKAIGKQAGVDTVVAEVLPQGKEQTISEYSKKGKIAMVGDGINDAPALMRADIGMAIGAGTDVAIDAADVVLMKSNLEDVPAAIRLSKAVLKNIHENLFWAFIYNIIGIPLAAGIWYPLFGIKLNPMFGAAAMSLSSFCVVTNALRLNLFKVHGESRKKNDENNKYDHDNEIMNEDRKKATDNKKISENFKKIKEQEKTSEENKKIINEKENSKMEKVMVIKGMMCGHCEATVKKALEALPEVDEAIVSHEKNEAVVKLNAEISDDVLKKTVEDKEYTVEEIK